MELIISYILAIVVGLVLGLIGGGGSILTVPILVYILGLNPVLATAYSLFIVGLASLFGASQYIRQKLVDYKIAIVFAIPALISVFITRKYLIPAFPDQIIISGYTITKGFGIMVFFAFVMLFSAASMIRFSEKINQAAPNVEGVQYYPLISVIGVTVGLVSGTVGAGGGFLIIPALVLLANLPMKTAVGTSLFIICINSLVGFTGDVFTQKIDWAFLFSFAGLAVVGIFIGIYLSKKISGNNLKKGFGWFVLVISIYILVKEILFK